METIDGSVIMAGNEPGRKRLLSYSLFLCIVCCGVLLICILALWRVSPAFLFFLGRWSSDPDWSPDGKRVVFTCHYPSLRQVWDRKLELYNYGVISEATEICTAHADGSHLVRLTHNQVSDGYPAWSPDGRSIAYFSGFPDTAVYLTREDGSHQTELTKNLQTWFEKPAWSPDGEWIAFVAYNSLEREQGLNLYVANIGTREIRALTALQGDELEVRWSPDGRRLAFASFPEGFRDLASERAAIMTVDIDGNGMAVTEDFALIGDLTWSRDGTELAFWGYPSRDCAYDYDSRCAQIYVVDLSNGLVNSLTAHHQIYVYYDMAWSPDGEQIAFSGLRGPDGSGVYAIRPDGSGLHLITTPHVAYHDLVWVPDGQFIAFTSGRIEGDKSRIWLIDVERGKTKELGVP